MQQGEKMPIRSKPQQPTEAVISALIGKGGSVATHDEPHHAKTRNFRDLSRKREISEQFVWLNRQYGETEAQLSRSAITPSIRADSSQDEGL